MKKLPKILAITFAVWALLCLPSIFGVRLLCTSALCEWARSGDAPIHTIHHAFLKDGTYLLDYDTDAPGRPRNWARLIQPIPDTNPQYEIHRQQMTSSDTVGAIEIPVIVLRQHLTADAQDSFTGDAIRGFAGARNAKGLKEIYVHRCHSPIKDSSTVYEDTSIYLPVEHPTYHTMELFGNHPQEQYMDPSKRMSVILKWPFAAVGDILTLPLLFFIPRWG